MTTVTIHLPAELKARIAKAVKSSGTTTHDFILEAIAEKVSKYERSSDLNKAADERLAAIVANGESIPWPVAREYLQSRLGGAKAKRPAPRKLG